MAVSKSETAVSGSEMAVSESETAVSAAETTVFRPLKRPFSYFRTRKRYAKILAVVFLVWEPSNSVGAPVAIGVVDVLFRAVVVMIAVPSFVNNAFVIVVVLVSVRPAA